MTDPAQEVPADPPIQALNAFDLGKIIWEARLREAWGAMAHDRISRTPWPPHETHPSRTADHDLAIASARAVLARFSVVAP